MKRENLPRMAQRLLSLPVPVDLLVVDDNSPDRTANLPTIWPRNIPKSTFCIAGQKRPGRAYIADSNGLSIRVTNYFRNGLRFSHNPDDIRRFSKLRKRRTLISCSARAIPAAARGETGAETADVSRSAGVYVRVSPECRSPTRRGLQMFPPPRVQAIHLDEVARMLQFSNRDDAPALAAGLKCRGAIIFTDRIEGHSKMAATLLPRLCGCLALWLQNGCAAGR